MLRPIISCLRYKINKLRGRYGLTKIYPAFLTATRRLCLNANVTAACISTTERASTPLTRYTQGCIQVASTDGGVVEYETLLVRILHRPRLVRTPVGIDPIVLDICAIFRGTGGWIACWSRRFGINERLRYLRLKRREFRCVWPALLTV